MFVAAGVPVKVRLFNMLILDTYPDKNPVVQGLSNTPTDLYKQVITGKLAKDFAYNPDTQSQPESEGFEIPLENLRGTDIADMWKEEQRVSDKKKSHFKSVKSAYNRTKGV